MIVDLLYVPAADKDYLEGQIKRLQIIENDLLSIGIKNRTTQIRSPEEIIHLINKGNCNLVLSISDEIQDGTGTTQDIHNILDQWGVAYVGSTSENLRLCRSKSALKRVLNQENVLTPEFMIVNQKAKTASLITKLQGLEHYPYIVKPDHEGNSAGISKLSVCKSIKELQQRIRESLEKFDTVLVEQYMGYSDPFREYTVALIGVPPNALVLPARVQFKDPSVQRPITTADKDQHRTSAAPVKDPLRYKKVAELARKAFSAAGVRDYARCDVIQSDDQFYVLEINGQPMIPDLWFEACCRSRNLSRKQYLFSIMLSALVRLNLSGKYLRIQKTLVSAIPKNVSEILTRKSLSVT